MCAREIYIKLKFKMNNNKFTIQKLEREQKTMVCEKNDKFYDDFCFFFSFFTVCYNTNLKQAAASIILKMFTLHED